MEILFTVALIATSAIATEQQHCEKNSLDCDKEGGGGGNIIGENHQNLLVSFKHTHLANWGHTHICTQIERDTYVNEKTSLVY